MTASTAQKEAYKKYQNKHPEVRMYSSSKARAKATGAVHTLSVTYLRSIMPKECPYFKVPFTNTVGEGGGPRHSLNPSIDRIDPSKGYVEGNVQIVSFLANKMKSDSTPEQLQRFAMSVLGIDEM